jgi:Tat protein translocase TatC
MRKEISMFKIQHYFQEIRIRTLYFIFSFFLCLSISYFFVDDLFYIFTNFLFEIEQREKSSLSDFQTQENILQSVEQEFNFRSESQIIPKFIFTDITEAFHTSLSLAFGFTLYIQIPFILYTLWSFFVPSLHFQERNTFSQYCLIFLFFYFLATGVILYFIFPLLWSFFIHFETKSEFLDIHCEARISSYISFIFKTCFISNIIFQFPLFTFLLLQFDFFCISDILQNRRFIYWGGLLLSAIIAPPDYAIQISISFFLLIIFEICFFFILLFDEYTKDLKIREEKRKTSV